MCFSFWLFFAVRMIRNTCTMQAAGRKHMTSGVLSLVHRDAGKCGQTPTNLISHAITIRKTSANRDQ